LVPPAASLVDFVGCQFGMVPRGRVFLAPE
jgi:hypothetical protein